MKIVLLTAHLNDRGYFFLLRYPQNVFFFFFFLEPGMGWGWKRSEMFEDSLQSVNDLKFMVFLSILHIQ